MSIGDFPNSAQARRAAEAVAEVVAISDTVRIGRGQKLWTVESLWEHNGSALARLVQVDGYSHTSVHVASLHVVAKAGAS